MKKIFLIGKMSEDISRIHDCLTEMFTVHLSPVKSDVIKDMMNIIKPDMVILYITEPLFYYTDIFGWFNRNALAIPVLIISDKARCEQIQKMKMEINYEMLLMNFSDAALLNVCCTQLEIEPPAGMVSPFESNLTQEEAIEIYGKKTVLIVDDNPIVLRNAKAMLQDSYDVVLATSGELAIEKCLEERPDIVLLDYEMPGMNGKETFDILTSYPEFSNLPIVFLTGVSDRETVMEILKSKPAGYLLKPSSKEQMLETIKMLIGY